MSVPYTGPMVVGQLTCFFGQDDGDAGSPETVRAPLPWTQSDAAKAAFIALLTGIGEESFEGFADGTPPPLVLDFDDAGTVDIDSDSHLGFVNDLPIGGGPGGIDTNGAGRYPSDGDKYFDARAGFTFFNFSRADIRAVGFRAIDLGDFLGQFILTVTFQDDTQEEYEPPHLINDSGDFPAAGSIAYIGIIAGKAIKSVLFESSVPGFDIFAFDEFTIATAAQAGIIESPTLPASAPDIGPFIPDFDPCTARPPRRNERWERCSRCGFCFPQSEVVIQQGSGGGVIVCIRYCLDDPSRRDLRPDELPQEAPLSFVDDEGPTI